MRKSLLAALLLPLPLLATGCAWVKLEPQARPIRVAAMQEDLSACTRLGEIAVSVKDGVGPVGRNPIKVRDELETLARNEAVGLQADTVQPRAEPERGQQRYHAFRCAGAAGTATRAPESTTNEDGVEVFRIE
ncbi:MAG: DUF4156 domain-containing protein [Lysobacteraceae bacterium]|jgi:hypothetical protein